MEIREATKGELLAYALLGKESFEEYHGVFSRHVPEIIEYFSDYATKNEGVFVAIQDNTVVGGICIRRIDNNEFRLNHLVVKSSFKEKGVGKQLVDFALKRLSNKHQEIHVTAKIMKNVEELRKFWERLGFKIGGEDKHWHDPQKKVYIMVKQL